MAISTRLANGKVGTGFATFIVLNQEGWVATAAHVLNAAQAAGAHAQAKADIERKIAEIRADNSLTVKQKNRQLEPYKPNPEWIVNQSLWWGQDGAIANHFIIDAQADIAIAQLQNFVTVQVAQKLNYRNLEESSLWPWIFVEKPGSVDV